MTEDGSIEQDAVLGEPLLDFLLSSDFIAVVVPQVGAFWALISAQEVVRFSTNLLILFQIDKNVVL
jgi:hypothetical protein